MPSRHTGRTPKLADKELREKLLQAIRDGHTRAHASALVGIDPTTFSIWCRRGKTLKSGIYHQFNIDVKKAEAEAIEKKLGTIRKAANDGNWTAAAWWLERRHPSDYGSHKTEIRVMIRELKSLVGELRAYSPAGEEVDSGVQPSGEDEHRGPKAILARTPDATGESVGNEGDSPRPVASRTPPVEAATERDPLLSGGGQELRDGDSANGSSDQLAGIPILDILPDDPASE